MASDLCPQAQPNSRTSDCRRSNAYEVDIVGFRNTQVTHVLGTLRLWCIAQPLPSLGLVESELLFSLQLSVDATCDALHNPATISNFQDSSPRQDRSNVVPAGVLNLQSRPPRSGNHQPSRRRPPRPSALQLNSGNRVEVGSLVKPATHDLL